MTTPLNNVSFTDIQTEFGGISPISINEYYAGGAYVVPGTSGIPSSGIISMNDLRNKTKVNYGTASASNSTRPEGSSFTISVQLNTVVNTTVYWKVVLLTNLQSTDFVSMSGSVAIGATGAGSFSVNTISDALFEGSGTFYIALADEPTVSVEYVTTSTLTVTENLTYTPQPISNSNPYRFGNLSFREVTCVLNTSATVPNGTVIYWNLSNASVTTSDVNSISGNLTINSSTGSVTINVLEINNGSTVASESFAFRFYEDSARTILVATSGTVVIRAAPTFTGSIPTGTTISEGQISQYSITTTNVPDGTLLYITRSTSSTAIIGTFASYPTDSTTTLPVDLLAGSSSGSVATITNNTISYVDTQANTVCNLFSFMDGVSESNETLIMQIRTVSHSGSIVYTYPTVTIQNRIGVFNSCTITKTGGDPIGTNVIVTLALTISSTYANAGGPNYCLIEYNINNQGWSSSGLLTQWANFISFSTNTLPTNITLKNSASTQACTSVQVRVSKVGWTTILSNTITGGFI